MGRTKAFLKILLQLTQRPSRSPIGVFAIRWQTSYPLPAPELNDKCRTPHPPGPSGDDPSSKFYMVPPDTPYE